MENDRLRMTFDPLTIEHLGVRMYSTLPPVLAELIANSFDADATVVTVLLNDQGGGKEITVLDDGSGMSFEDTNKKFLRIGRNRRKEEGAQISEGGRKVIGKKGLGKLSFFGIAHEIEITTEKDGKINEFVLRWEDIKNAHATSEYNPRILRKDDVCAETNHGTKIILRDIQRETDFSAEAIADSLSKIFIVEEGFKIVVQRNQEAPIEINNLRRYRELNVEVEWNVPADLRFESSYDKKSQVTGQLMATGKPISPRTNVRGIVLFSRKKLVNVPEYFSDSTSSHVFSYLTGWLEVDFIDDLPEDVISTDRQSVNWGHPEMLKLRIYLQEMIRWIEQDWRAKRAKIRQAKLEERTGLKIGEWRQHLPPAINENLEAIINALTRDAELADEKAVNSLKGLQEIIKPYPYFHWQNLHPTLHELAFPFYKNEDYYKAVAEGVKKYIRDIQAASTSGKTDRALIEHVFSPLQPPPPAPKVLPELSVTKKFKRPNGTDFEVSTTSNISNGHGLLARAMWLAFRNPLAHELASDLKDSGLYTEQDCLDALGLLSHLFRRLDNSLPTA